MNNPNFTHDALGKHVSHRLTVVQYGLKNVLECTTCGDELYEITSDKLQNTLPITFPEPSGSCNMDEGCTSCGS